MPGNKSKASVASPPLQYNRSGVPSVKPADILRSERGQEQIRKAAAVAVALKLRPEGTAPVGPAPAG